MSVNEQYIILSLIIPLLTSGMMASINTPNVRDAAGMVMSLAMLFNTFVMFDLISAKQQISYHMADIVPGISIAFNIEPLGMIFALILSILWPVSIIYSIGYMRANDKPGQSKFFAFFAFSIFAATAIAYSGNMFTLFVFYEVLTLCTYPLVTHDGTGEARKGGRIYLSVLMGSSLLFLLPAIALTWHFAGTLDFTCGGIMKGKIDGLLFAVLLALYVYGIGKAALMPMHRWLPAAMVAPTPVSALLHAVAVVKAGVFTIVKVMVYIFGVNYTKSMVELSWINGQWLVYISGFTIVVASIVALMQDNLKKRLAYSTVSQLSYVIIAVSMFTPKALIAAVFHIVAHAFGKITLFFAAGSIYTASHKKKVSQLSGIGKRMPLTMAAFTIASLSMIGLPPFVGFISKWYLLTGAAYEQNYFVVAVIVISTILNALYLLPIVYVAFFEKEKPKKRGSGVIKNHGEAPVMIVMAIIITAIMTMVLFFQPDIFMDLVVRVGK